MAIFAWVCFLEFKQRRKEKRNPKEKVIHGENGHIVTFLFFRERYQVLKNQWFTMDEEQMALCYEFSSQKKLIGFCSFHLIYIIFIHYYSYY